MVIFFYGSKFILFDDYGEILFGLLVEVINSCLEKLVEKRLVVFEVVEQLWVFLYFGVDRFDEGESLFCGLLLFIEEYVGLFFGCDVEIDRFVE